MLPLVPVVQCCLTAAAAAAAAVAIGAGAAGAAAARVATVAADPLRVIDVFQAPLASDAAAADAAASSPLLPEHTSHLSLRGRMFFAGELNLEYLSRSPRFGSYRR